jgi:hypothetical protein
MKLPYVSIKVITLSVISFLICTLVAHQTQAQEKVLLVPYHAKNGWGFSDTLANIVIEPAAYDSVELFDYWGLAKVYRKKKVNVINSKGKVLLKEYCDKITWKTSGEWELGIDDKVGVYDPKKRRYVVDVRYDEVSNLTEKVKLVTQQKKLAVFSMEGKQLTDFKFDSLAAFFDDYLVAYAKGKLFEVNATNGKITPVKEIREPEYGTMYAMEELATFDPGIEPEPAPHEFIDRITTNFELDSMTTTPIVLGTGTEIYQVYRGGKTAYYFRHERLMMKPKFDAVLDLQQSGEGKFEMIAILNGRYGVIDQNEKIVIPFEFDRIHSLNSSFAYTTLKGKEGVWIFNTVYPPIKNLYDRIGFEDRLNVSMRWSFILFKVHRGEKWGYVGENGVEYFD